MRRVLMVFSSLLLLSIAAVAAPNAQEEVGARQPSGVIAPSSNAPQANNKDQMIDPRHDLNTSRIRPTSSTTAIRINEVVFHPESGGCQWVEIKNQGLDSIDISGYTLTDEDDHWYEFPSDMPGVPAGAFVVVMLDGVSESQNDLDFSDNLAILHAPPELVGALDGKADQVSLYKAIKPNHVFLPLVLRSDHGTQDLVSGKSTGLATTVTTLAEPTMISFVAWGDDPLADIGEADSVGLWSVGDFVPVSATGLGTEILEGESIGLLPDSLNPYARNWTLYPLAEVTFGYENPPPAINSYHPRPGDTLDSETFMFAWNLIENAVGYRFQLDDSQDFSSPYTDTIVDGPAYVAPSPIPEGVYYWRVKTILPAGESTWSPGIKVRSLEYPKDILASQAAEIGLLGIEWQLQRKDTNMLCLYGDPETGDAPWDSPHPANGGVKPHGVNYCSRAAISMLVSYYGSRLSQDRIAYYDYRNADKHILDTYNTIGHGRVNSFYLSTLLDWAGIPYNQVSSPTYEDIKGWIEQEHPVVAWIKRPGRDDKFVYHFVVIDGYRQYTKDDIVYGQIHVLDPWDGAQWPLFDEYKAYIRSVYIGPNYIPLGLRQDNDDEYRIDEDTDGDGICDFDEFYRFGTDPQDMDTDDDGVPDKEDLREYVFSPATGDWRLRWADWDGDGNRKELDPDNDHRLDDGSPDGCEDSNHNGRYEPDLGETSNFDPAQEIQCGPQ